MRLRYIIVNKDSKNKILQEKFSLQTHSWAAGEERWRDKCTLCWLVPQLSLTPIYSLVSQDLITLPSCAIGGGP